MIKKELACVRRLAPGSKQSQSTHVLHICRRLAASWDKLGGLSAEPRGTGQARHHRLGQTAGMRRQRRLGGSSPSRATAMGQRVRILTGKGVCFPQTSHLAQAKMPDQSFSTCVRRNIAVALGTLHYVKDAKHTRADIAADGNPAGTPKATVVQRHLPRENGQRLCGSEGGRNGSICRQQSPGLVTH